MEKQIDRRFFVSFKLKDISSSNIKNIIKDLYVIGIDGVVFPASKKVYDNLCKEEALEKIKAGKSESFKFGIKAFEKMGETLLQKVIEERKFHLYFNFPIPNKIKKERNKKIEFLNTENEDLFDSRIAIFGEVSIHQIDSLVLNGVTDFVLPLNVFLFSGMLNLESLKEFLYKIKSFKPPE